MGYRGEDASRTPANWGQQPPRASSPGNGQGSAGSWTDGTQGYGNDDYDDFAPGGDGSYGHESSDGYGGAPGYGYGQQPGYDQQSYSQPPEPGYGGSGGGPQRYPAANDDPGRRGGYPPRHSGDSGAYPTYPGQDAGSDWYGGQPAAASGASFADTGTYALNGRIIDEYGTGPREALRNPTRGYPPGPGQPQGPGQVQGPGQPQGPGQVQGRAQLPAPARPMVSGPQAVPRTGPQAVPRTGPQQQYDNYQPYPGYSGEDYSGNGYGDEPIADQGGRGQSGDYPTAFRSPAGEYPTAVRNPTGGYPEPARNPSGGYPAADRNPSGSFTAGDRNPSGAFTAPARNPSGGFTAGDRNPSGAFTAPARNPSGAFTAPARNPSGGFTAGDRNPSGAFTAPARNPSGGFTAGDRNPSGSFTAPARNPSGEYPAAGRGGYDAYAGGYGQDGSYRETSERGYDDYPTDADTYQDRYGTDTGQRGAGAGGRSKARKPATDRNRRPAVQGGRRGRRSLVVTAISVVAVLIVGVAAYFFLLRSPAAKNPDSADPFPTGSALPSTQPCVQQFGSIFCHIVNRADDPTPLTIAQLFPPVVNNETNGHITSSFTLATTKVDTKCANAVIGAALIAKLQTGQCTQVLRASYVSGDGKIMGTIGVINLDTTNEAHYAGKVIDANDFIAPLAASKGVASKLGKGTGVVEASFKGHYLILTWSEYVDGTTPSTTAEDKELELFSSDLVAGTVNDSLSQRMVTGVAPSPGATA
jgi:hypothetical protein